MKTPASGLERSVSGGCSPGAGNIGALHPPEWAHGHSAAQGRNKRKRGRRDPPQRSKSASTKQTTPNFACHFYLHDRIEHSGCLNISFKRIADVRQHLLERAHFQVVHCPVCGRTFPGRPAEARQQRDAHVQAATCEPLESLPYYRGITEDQDREIRDIAHTTRHNQRSQVQRWFDIWDCLFPSEQHPPSPFLTNLPDIQRVADWRSVIFDNDSDLWCELPTAPWTDTMRLEEQRAGMSNFIDSFLLLSRRLFSPDASPAEDDHEAGTSSYMGVNTPAPSSAFANIGLVPPASFDLDRPVVDSIREHFGPTYATGPQHSQRRRQAGPRLGGRPAPVPIQALTYPAVDVPQDTPQDAPQPAAAEEDYIYSDPLTELLNLAWEHGQGD